MKTKLCIIAISLASYVLCDDQLPPPKVSPDSLKLMPSRVSHGQPTKPEPASESKWLEAAEEREKMRAKKVADLKTDLASAWTTLVVAQAYDCKCTGPMPSLGFQITRQGDVIFAAAWVENERSSRGLSRERTGEARQITKVELERLISETISYYEAATRSLSAREMAGPPPVREAEQKAWFKRYLEAGGTPEGQDERWFEVRLGMPDGMKQHRNQWGGRHPEGMTEWLAAFGMLLGR